MNMWIRSVLNVLWNINNIKMIFPEQYNDNWAVFVLNGHKEQYVLGVYKSERTALDVMEALEVFIARNQPGSIFIMPRDEEKVGETKS